MRNMSFSPLSSHQRELSKLRRARQLVVLFSLLAAAALACIFAGVGWSWWLSIR